MSDNFAIIDTFLKGIDSGTWRFVPLAGDASGKRYFRIQKNKKPTNWLLLLIPLDAPRSDECFIIDNSPPELTQADYFIEISEFLANYFKNVPRIYSSEAREGLVILQDLGSKTLFDHIKDRGEIKKQLEQEEFEKLSKQMEKHYQDLLFWINKLQGLSDKLPEKSLIRNRTLEKQALREELREFETWVLEPKLRELQIEENERSSVILDDVYRNIKGTIQKGFDRLVEVIDEYPKTLIHRDFQSKNVMIHDGEPFIIDVQDVCFGPYIYDLASLLYDANAMLSHGERDYLASSYYYSYISWEAEPNENSVELMEFLKNLQLMGLQRVLKNMGRHSKYYLRDSREASGAYLVRNLKVFLSLRNEVPFNTDFKSLLDLLEDLF